MDIKKKILLLTDELRIGGGETYFLKIENNFNSELVELFTAAKTGVCEEQLINKKKFFELYKSNFRNMMLINKIVKKEGIKVIHANSLTLSILSMFAKIMSFNKVKIYYTKHNITILEKINDKVFAGYVNLVIDKLLTVSDHDKDEMVKKGVKKEKIQILRNSTDIDKLEFNPHYFKRKESEDLNIGILARLSEEKNHDLFIDIIEELNIEKSFKFNAFIGGDGPLRADIEKNINNKNLPIQMLGQINDVKQFLENMDIVLLVSKREVFPMTILEAFSVGALVVSVDVGGVSDCVKNTETGYLVNSYVKKDYKNIILNIQRNINENKQIILNARDMVNDRYSLKKMMFEIEKIYMEE